MTLVIGDVSLGDPRSRHETRILEKAAMWGQCRSVAGRGKGS